MHGADEARQLVASLCVYLEDLQESGIDGLAYGESAPAVDHGNDYHSATSPPASVEPAPAEGSPPDPVSAEKETLDKVRLDLGNCTRCGLSGTRTNLVFGIGNPAARLVFVGEAPGRDEDLQGEPFVGEAGQLLTKIIGAMQFKRSDVYICNILKCRPPGNRNPQQEEIEQCQPFLLRQLHAVNPEAIVCLGTFAAQTLLQTKEPISKLRGRFHDYHGIPLMPTFHPAFLLRNPAMKREVWEDMQKVMRLLDIELKK
ncbi:uracil-DNA glycosylase [Geotalea daltonii FRC-32]|uniref:Type-4 uracil-DNA glycosylase n=1 Tax=Geotalea daltonii (strain DSM 22248 / JCM 15807 / FRC-32) TaxID=316067 RepID=B9M678_GEODF|nr:uracil-DNA glycosylase [Geotalea daltonii]ACM21866.1 uracil-DNA glycosylase [Geotalea daltonii FRC-32]